MLMYHYKGTDAANFRLQQFVIIRRNEGEESHYHVKMWLDLNVLIF